jgi:uncharacterized membrane protein YqjE
MFDVVDRLQELTGRLTEQIQTLVRLELQLAQAEMAEKAKSAARAAIFGAVAGVFLFFSTFSLLIAAIWGLAETGLPIWASALIITFVFVLIAGLVALLALRRARKATPPVPEAAIAEAGKISDDLKSAIG